MVVGLVFKQQEPVLVFSVHVHLYLDGAGVYLLRLVQLVQLALSLKVLHRYGADVHQSHRLGSAERFSQVHISVVCLLQIRVFKLDAVDDGVEGGVAAVIRPVGVYHLDFRYGRVSVFLLEVFSAKPYVRQIHGKASVGYESL